MPESGKQQPESHRVYQLLSSAIRRGRIGPATSIDVRDLMEQYGSTRNAVRAALTMLAEEGTLERAPRRGTHVSTHVSGIDLSQLRTHRNLALPLQEVFTQNVEAPALVADRFGDAARGVPILLIERLLGKVGTLCLETSYILAQDDARARRFLEIDTQHSERASLPLEEYFEAVYDEDLRDVELSVQVTTAQARIAELLELEAGTPIFLIERVLSGPSGPLEISFAASDARHNYLAVT